MPTQTKRPVRPFSEERRTHMLLAGLSLGALLVTTAALTVRAVAADRTARRSAARSMTHLASVAAWELSRHLSARLETAARMATAPAARLNGRIADTATLGERLLPAASMPPCDCPGRILASGAFEKRLFGPYQGVRLTGTGWSATDTAWIDSMVRSLQEQPEHEDATTTISPHDGLSIQLLESASRGEPRLLMTQPVSTIDGRRVAVYGALVSSPAADSFFTSSIAAASLLPESVTERMRRDSLVQLSILARDGTRLFRTDAAAAHTDFAARFPLGAIAPGLVVEARLLSPASSVVAGLTPARAGIPVLLFIIASVLTLAVAWTLLRSARLDALRSDFIAGVSHQFHTPLALISAYAETAASGRTTNESERGQFLMIVSREAQRLSHLVDNVLRVTASGRSPGSPLNGVVPLADVVVGACEEFGVLAASRRCVVTADVRTSPHVRGDAAAIRNVMFNVLDNAMRYGGDGQEIRATVDADTTGAAEVIIDDQGPGIATDPDRARVFHRFERLTSSLGPDAVAGTGIGLAIVRDIMEAHGGSASIESAPTGGTRVRLSWPATPGALSR